MSDKTVGQQILERIKALEDLLRIASMERKLEDLEKQIKTVTSPEKKGLLSRFNLGKNKERQSDSLSEALNNLEELTTVKKDENGKRTFLLHRPTDDFEYSKSTDTTSNQYITSKDTSWIAEIEAAEHQQRLKNPVVSVWVPEASITKITGAENNTGTWNDLGSNPHATKFQVLVAPGKYEIRQELRQ